MNADEQHHRCAPSRATAMDATGLAELIRDGEAGAREVAEAAIERIEECNGDLNAVVATRFEQALEEIDAGLPEGPLRGVPILVKDLGTNVAGVPSTRGSRLFADNVPTRDSELVARYRRAGMVVLGTTNTPEFGLNASTEPQLFGPTRNPWNGRCSPGGSSGGSAAAVAAGMTPVAHGTDGGGSIRLPAAMCGLVGLKPSRGRVTPAPAPSLLSGPVGVHHALTTTVRDSALLLDVSSQALAGDAFAAPSPNSSFVGALSEDPGRLCIGVATELPGGPATDPEIAETVLHTARLCADLGHEVVEVNPPHDPSVVGQTAAPLMGIEFTVSVHERLAELGRELRPDDVEPFTHMLLAHYSAMSAMELNRAQRRAQEIGWEVGRMFDEVDVLLTPTTAVRTPLHGTLDTTRPETIYDHGAAFAAWTSVFNVTGAPAISLPLGTDADGLPLGAQLAADLGQEGRLLRLAAQLEQADAWPRVAPGYSADLLRSEWKLPASPHLRSRSAGTATGRLPPLSWRTPGNTGGPSMPEPITPEGKEERRWIDGP